MAKTINFKNVAKEEMANVVLAALEAAGLEFMMVLNTVSKVVAL